MSKIGVSESVPQRPTSGVPASENWDGPLGLADRFDDLLLRLEVWRERPKVAGSLIVASALLAASAWWLSRPVASTAVEDVIPMATVDGTAAGADLDAAPDSDPHRGSSADSVPMPTTAGTGGSTGQPGAGGGFGGLGGSSQVAEAEKLVVHMVGAVREPGLVQVMPGARIDDALRAAGGPTEDADVERLNLAALVADGMQVRVPADGEDPDGTLIVAPPPVAAGVGVAVGSGAEVEAGAGAGPMNLNTASETRLQDLPGVGPATAAAIVAWRDDNGGFLTVDDLNQVPGIGPVKLAALRDLVTV